uniref:Uncharacterized protein n=1 Tax=Rhipicephalus microplus TaxID=6941 RepID=A0A6G5AH26_RHIMP
MILVDSKWIFCFFSMSINFICFLMSASRSAFCFSSCWFFSKSSAMAFYLATVFRRRIVLRRLLNIWKLVTGVSHPVSPERQQAIGLKKKHRRAFYPTGGIRERQKLACRRLHRPALQQEQLPGGVK